MAAEGTPALVARAVGCPVGDEREGERRPAGDDQFYPPCSVSAASLSADTRGDGDFQWRHLSMVEMEMDAAQVLANFAQIAFLEKASYGQRGGERDDSGGNIKEAGSRKGAKNGSLVGGVSKDHLHERGISKLNPSSSFRAQVNHLCSYRCFLIPLYRILAMVCLCFIQIPVTPRLPNPRNGVLGIFR